MSEQTYHTTRQDLRKEESRTAHQSGGKTPADSDVSILKVSSFIIPIRRIALTIPGELVDRRQEQREQEPED